MRVLLDKRFVSMGVMYLLVSAIIIAGALSYTQYKKTDILQDAKEVLSTKFHTKLTRIAESIKDEALGVLTTSELILNNHLLQLYFDHPDQHNKKRIESAWRDLISQLNAVDQLQIVDRLGWELVSADVNKHSVKGAINSSGKYIGDLEYFAKAKALEPGERFIYIIGLEKDDQGNKIHELAFHIIYKIEDRRGQFYYFVVSLDAKNVFRRALSGYDSMDNTEILNQEGFYVLSTDKSKLFGQFFEDRSHFNFYEEHPNLKPQITNSNSGKLTLDNGFMQFVKVSIPLHNNEYRDVILIRNVPFTEINKFVKMKLKDTDKFLFSLLLLGLIAALPITWHLHERRRIKLNQQLATAALKSTTPIVISDFDNNIYIANNAFCKIANISNDDFSSEKLNTLLNIVVTEEQRQAIRDQIKSTGHWSGEIKSMHPGSEGDATFYLMTSQILEKTQNTTTPLVVTNLVDISWQKTLENKLVHLNLTDQLTSLPNRRAYDQQMLKYAELQERYPEDVFVLAIVDIDHFKAVNDTHGHEVGDQVLIRFSKTVSNAMRKIDTIYRIGGEEFVLLLPKTSQQNAAIVLERIRRAIESDKTEPMITCSIGFVSSVQNANNLFKAADKALYKAKSSGRNQVCIFDAGSQNND